MGTLDLNLVGMPRYAGARQVMHFYCGDEVDNPTSLLTFMVDACAAPGTRGSGQISAVTFAIPTGSMWHWQRRLERAGSTISGRAWAFGKEHLCFSDPDGLQLAMVEESPNDQPVPLRSIDLDYEIERISAVEIQVTELTQTARFLTRTLGFTRSGREGSVSRFSHGAMGRVISLDVLAAPQHRSGFAGSGVPHDLVWRVADESTLRAIATAVKSTGVNVTAECQQDHFKAIYFHDPCGIHFAVALDAQPSACVEPC
jgi:glyoxalase family protein